MSDEQSHKKIVTQTTRLGLFLIVMLILWTYDMSIFSNPPAYSMQSSPSSLSAASEHSNGIRIIVDNSSIPLIDYGYVNGTYIGLQRNPLTVASYALQYYNSYKLRGDERSKQSFLNDTNWLTTSAIPRSNYSLLEYKFPWPRYDLSPPWHSAYSQAQASLAMAKAYHLTGDKKYLETSKMLLNSFFIEVKKGGVTYKTPNNGWWYEAYAGNGSKESRELTGMMSSLIAIYNYYNFSHDDSAKYLFDQGVIALTKNLPNYDYSNGTLSYSDALAHVASSQEHNLHVDLLGHLYSITKQAIFKVYHDRWQNHKRI